MLQATFYQAKTLTNIHMKKIILCLILTASAITASAQSHSFNLKVDTRDELGIGAGLTYGVNKHFNFNPAFIYFPHTGNSKYWSIDFDFHYNLYLTKNFKAYPIIGFAIFHRGGNSYNYSGSTNAGSNLGLGCEYDLSKRVTGFAEIKNQNIKNLGDETYASLGIKIGF